jgi:hypothetical protein
MKASLTSPAGINWRFFRSLVRWFLFAAVLLYIVSGYGISNPGTVESLTFGLITKSVAFTIHNNIFIPFVLLMFLHILPFFIRWFHRIYHRNGTQNNSIS